VDILAPGGVGKEERLMMEVMVSVKASVSISLCLSVSVFGAREEAAREAKRDG
jgi:hypothetical protein